MQDLGTSLRVKVYGAGSIGNHFAHAASTLGWTVALCDVDRVALTRTKFEIFPERYGKWDPAIELYEVGNEPTGDFDLIIVGTPPNSHVAVARGALLEEPQSLLIEKPLSGPDLTGLAALRNDLSKSKTHGFVGYNHLLSPATSFLRKMLSQGHLGEIITLDVEFRENWSGIFAAHPWLSGPEDSYLGFSRHGGGALGEHSHGISLWQHLARVAGCGEIVDVEPTIRMKSIGEALFDDYAALGLRTESGLVGTVIQDVSSWPARKRARVVGKDGYAEISFGIPQGSDSVSGSVNGNDFVETFPKTRPQEFIRELEHIEDVLAGDVGGNSSPISFESGVATSVVLAKAFSRVFGTSWEAEFV